MLAPTPDGRIDLFSTINIDSDYNHTLYFDSIESQTSFFNAEVEKSFTRCQYIRETGGVRVPISADSISNYNYMRYKNAQYLNRWYYAFIKNVKYINDNTAEIEFEIDVIQSYILYCYFPPCWIERNHVKDDSIGANRVEEPISIGHYVVDKDFKFAEMGDEWDVVLFSTFDPYTYEDSGGTLTYGMYTALKRTVIGRISFTATEAIWLDDASVKMHEIVTEHADKIDGILGLYIAPHAFETTGRRTLTVNRNTATSGMKPKNNKLFTAPFYTLYLSTGTDGKTYDFDESNQGSLDAIKFTVTTDHAPNQTISAIPTNYKGSAMNYNEMMVMSGFPQCAWTSNAYEYYIAQNSATKEIPAYIGAGVAIAGLAASVPTGGLSLAAAGAIAVPSVISLTNIMTERYQESIKPPQPHGTISGTALYTIGEKTFHAYILRPCDEYVQIIDDYFTKYGYAIRKTETPSFNNRERFTFIKTIDCICRANAPESAGSAEVRRKIEQILDNGITFWKNNATVGSYTGSNKPI